MKKLIPQALVLCCGLFIYAFRLPAPVSRPIPVPSTVQVIPRYDTASPVTLVSLPPNGPLTLHIDGDSIAGHPTNIRLEWQLLLNGLPRQKGALPTLLILPGRPTTAHLPVHLPPDNEEAWLKLTARPAPGPASSHPTRPATGPTHTRPAPLFTQFLPLRAWRPDNNIPAAGELAFSDSNNLFTITSPSLSLQFDKQTGWMLHYEAGHVLLMGDSAGVQPLLWNPAVQPHLQLFSTSTGSQMVIVRAEYTIPEMSCLLHLSYTVNAAGEMLVSQSLEADSAAQTITLPHFGMCWQLPMGPDSTALIETAPRSDSMTWFGQPPTSDSAPAIYHLSLTPVTDSRETVYTGIRWLNLIRHDGKGLMITADSALLKLHIQGKTLDIESPLLSSPYQYTYKVTPLPLNIPTSAIPLPVRKQRQ